MLTQHALVQMLVLVLVAVAIVVCVCCGGCGRLMRVAVGNSGDAVAVVGIE